MLSIGLLLFLTLGWCSAYPSYSTTDNYTCTEGEQGATLVRGNMMLRCNGSMYLPEQCQMRSSLYVKVSEIKKTMDCNGLLNDTLYKCNHQCPFKTATCYCDFLSKVYETPSHQNDGGLFSYTIEKILPIKDRSKEFAEHAYNQLVMLMQQTTCEANQQQPRRSSAKYCVLPNHQCFDMANFHSLKTCNPAFYASLNGANDKESCAKVSKMLSKHTNPLAFQVTKRVLHLETCSYGSNPTVHHALRFVQSSTAQVVSSVSETTNSSEPFRFCLGYKYDGNVVVRNRCARKDALRSTLANNQYLKGVLETVGKCSFEQNADECVRKSVEGAYKHHRDALSASLFEKVLGLEACPVQSVDEPQPGHAQQQELLYQKQAECQAAAASSDNENDEEVSPRCFVEYSTPSGSKMVSISQKSLNSAFRCNGHLAELQAPEFSTTCRKIKDLYASHGAAAGFEDRFSRMTGAEDVTKHFEQQEKYSQHALEWAQSFAEQSSCNVEAEQSADERYECEFEGRLQSNFLGARTCFKTVNLFNTLTCNQKLNKSFTSVCPNKDKDCVCKTLQETYNIHNSDFALSLLHRIFNLETCSQVQQPNDRGFVHTYAWVRSSLQKSCPLSNDEN